MTPTEQESTVAVDAAARTLYASTGFPQTAPAFDDLDPLAQNRIRETVLPLVWAALQALPDRRAEGWENGVKTGAEHERAKWHWQGRNRTALAAMGLPATRPTPPQNPYRLETT